MSEANKRQVGGEHYRSDGIQHWDLISDTYGPAYLLGCATKYLARHRKKNGKQDLEKAEHYLIKIAEKLEETGARMSVRPADATLRNFTDGLCTADRLAIIMCFEAQTPFDFRGVADEVSILRQSEYG